MAAPVTCLPGTWTQLAPAAFGHAMIRFGHGMLRIEFAAAQPADTDLSAGIVIDGAEIQAMPMAVYPLRTGSPANAIWGRPVQGVAIVVERLF